MANLCRKLHFERKPIDGSQNWPDSFVRCGRKIDMKIRHGNALQKICFCIWLKRLEMINCFSIDFNWLCVAKFLC